MLAGVGYAQPVQPAEPVAAEEPIVSLTRAEVDQINATYELNRALTAKLVACNQTILEVTATSYRWTWTDSLKWAGIGAALVGSFVLGAWLL